jgi:hypothetical protein
MCGWAAAACGSTICNEAPACLLGCSSLGRSRDFAKRESMTFHVNKIPIVAVTTGRGAQDIVAFVSRRRMRDDANIPWLNSLAAMRHLRPPALAA